MNVMVKKKVEMLKCSSPLNFLDELAQATPPPPAKRACLQPWYGGRIPAVSPDLTVDSWSPGWGVICDVYFFYIFMSS